MDQRNNHFVEISGRIAAGRRFCEFLASGGRVLEQPDENAWRDVTLEVMEKERDRVAELERVRSLLYPDLAAEETYGVFSTH
jgi:hypothetical protein